MNLYRLLGVQSVADKWRGVADGGGVANRQLERRSVDNWAVFRDVWRDLIWAKLN